MEEQSYFMIMLKEIIQEPVALIFLSTSFSGIAYCIYLYLISHLLLKKIERDGPIENFKDITGFFFISNLPSRGKK
jgi:hypothetical protein